MTREACPVPFIVVESHPCDGMRQGAWVVYPRVADNVSGPLPIRLQEGIAGLTDKPGRGHRPEPGVVTPERPIVRFHQASITVSATSRHSA
jgi:hypothetical protein